MQPPLKSYPSLFRQPSLKVEVLWSLPLFENLVGGSIPPAERIGGCAHSVCDSPLKCFYPTFKEKLSIDALEFARRQVAIKTKIKSYFTLENCFWLVTENHWSKTLQLFQFYNRSKDVGEICEIIYIITLSSISYLHTYVRFN